MSDTYIFKKKGFKRRQSEKLMDANKRQAILMDCDLNRDPKMLALYAQKDVSLIGILFEIWANLDTITETWEVSKKHFDYWVKKTFSDNNRFNVLKRIKWLSENGLIEFSEGLASISEDSCKGLDNPYIDASEQLDNPQLDASKDLYNPSETPLEQAETQALTDPFITNTTNQNNQATTSSEGRFFQISNRGVEMREDEWIHRCLLERRRGRKLSVMGCDSLQALLTLYPTHQEEFKRWILNPIAIRMAAYVYTVIEGKPDCQLKYALTAAENASAYGEKFQGYIKRAEQYVEKGDLMVKING